MTFSRMLLFSLSIVSLAPTFAKAEMTFADMQKADALAKVIGNAEQCGYTIDDAKLEAYYSKSGLDSPEVFSHITNLLDVNTLKPSPTKSECTMARLTAKKIGILAP